MRRVAMPSCGCLLRIAALVSGVSVSAGSLSLDRFVIPGGGGTSSSARFSVDGSAGQPVAASDASVSSSLTLAERAGFWSQGVRWISVAPTAQSDAMERRAGQAGHVLIRSLLANDTATDLESLGFVSFSNTTTGGGTVLRDGPWLIYLPPTSGADPAQDSFTYTARDALGTLVTGTVRIQIAGRPAGGAPNAIGVDHLAGPPALVQVHFLGIAGRIYQVETANEANGPWVNSGTLTAAADGSMTYSEPDTGGSRFFRIRETP